MHQGLNPLFLQIPAQPIPVCGPDDIILEDIEPGILIEVGEHKIPNSSQPLPVSLGDLPAMLDPFRKMTQLHREHGRLDIVQ